MMMIIFYYYYLMPVYPKPVRIRVINVCTVFSSLSINPFPAHRASFVVIAKSGSHLPAGHRVASCLISDCSCSLVLSKVLNLSVYAGLYLPLSLSLEGDSH